MTSLALLVCLLSTAPPEDIQTLEVDGVQVSEYRSDHRAEYKTQLICWHKGKIAGYICVWPDQGQRYSLRGSRAAPLVLVFRPSLRPLQLSTGRVWHTRTDYDPELVWRAHHPDCQYWVR